MYSLLICFIYLRICNGSSHTMTCAAHKNNRNIIRDYDTFLTLNFLVAFNNFKLSQNWCLDLLFNWLPNLQKTKVSYWASVSVQFLAVAECALHFVDSCQTLVILLSSDEYDILSILGFMAVILKSTYRMNKTCKLYYGVPLTLFQARFDSLNI
jgi:hypothetical protein